VVFGIKPEQDPLPFDGEAFIEALARDAGIDLIVLLEGRFDELLFDVIHTSPFLLLYVSGCGEGKLREKRIVAATGGRALSMSYQQCMLIEYDFLGAQMNS
jgi:hypothetical protein